MLAALLLAGLVAAPALAAGARTSGGTSGNPQPELALFKLGSSGGNGSGVVLPDKDLVVVWPAGNGDTITVCGMTPGATSCDWTSTLRAYHGGGHQDSFGGTAVVLSTGGSDVTVVAEDCCYIPEPAEGGLVVFNSDNDGRSFGSETAAGTLGGLTSATYAGGDIVAIAGDASSTAVQAFSAHPTSVESTVARLDTTTDAEDVGVATYKDGVLVASDNGTDTRVWYARSGSDFASRGAYSLVATVTKQTLYGISGSALLTDVGGTLTGNEGVSLWFFNGSSFGTVHRVPQPPTPDDGAFNIQEVGSTAHVFFLDRRASYDIFSESTSDGVHWSGLSRYNTAITAGALIPVLGSIGSGICYETDSSPLYAQPILDPQSVSVSLEASKVKPGTSTKLNGKASPALSGQLVTLQRESGGLWYSDGTAHESSSGTFSFTIPGATDTYRAVVDYEPGYYLYGYSNAVTLTATS